MYTEKQKIASAKWRESHKDEWNAVCRRNMKSYYEKNKEQKRIQNLGRYYLKKEMELFRNILLGVSSPTHELSE